MPRLVWSDYARRDLDRLHGFLAAKNKKAAARAVKAIREGLRILQTHPETGRPTEDSPPEFRERVIEFGQRAYVALYHYDGAEVVILGIRHGREDGY